MKLQLKELRKKAGLNQQQMADKLGIPKRTYGSWERQEVEINLKQAFDCAVILECSIDELVGYTPPIEYSDSDQEALNGYYESMNDDGKKKLLDIAELAADSDKVRIQKKREGICIPIEMEDIA